jgi:hypothetical protein
MDTQYSNILDYRDRNRSYRINFQYLAREIRVRTAPSEISKSKICNAAEGLNFNRILGRF